MTAPELRYKLYAHHMKDVGCYLLTGFEAGVNYLIKGREYRPPYYNRCEHVWIEVTDLADVGLRVSVVDVPRHYIDSEGAKHTHQEYAAIKNGHKQKAFEVEDDRKVVVDRDAYELYKQVKEWTYVSETRKTVCDASLLEFEVIPDQFLSGSKFITNFRPLEAQTEARVWRYNRKGAVTDEILATFRRLGSECTGNDSWSPKVNEGNCWGNGTHSGWRYLKAWGGYVWEDKHEWLVRDNVREEVGVLADMHKCEEDERRMIRLRLEHLYRANFVKETLSANSLGEVTRALTNLIGKAKGLQTMQKSKTSRHSMIQALEDLKASLTAGVS